MPVVRRNRSEFTILILPTLTRVPQIDNVTDMANIKKRLARLVAARGVVENLDRETHALWPFAVEHAMIRSGLSLRALAKKIGVSPTYLCKIHTGDTRPSPKVEAFIVAEM